MCGRSQGRGGDERADAFNCRHLGEPLGQG